MSYSIDLPCFFRQFIYNLAGILLNIFKFEYPSVFWNILYRYIDARAIIAD